MICLFCYNKIDNDSNFCCYCGKKVNSDFSTQKINYSNYYVSKRYVITQNELRLYKVLFEVAKELNLMLFCQVSLYNILETKFNDNRYFNKIKSKSIDFVLVRKSDCRIVLCIELDDKTHLYQDRIERDNFVNQLFVDLDIHLLRIKNSQSFDKVVLKNAILSTLKSSKPLTFI